MEGEIECWAVDVSQWDPSRQELAKLLSLLDAESQQRIPKFYHPIDARRCLVGRLLPRLMFVQRHGLGWEELAFEKTPAGRPYLAGPRLCAPIDYNVSHDSSWVIMAFAPATSSRTSRSSLSIGADVMSHSIPSRHRDESAVSFVRSIELALSPVESAYIFRALRSVRQGEGADEEELVRRLFHIWTLKEAYLKATGTGFMQDPGTVEFRLPLWEDEETKEGEEGVWVEGVQKRGWRFAWGWLAEKEGGVCQVTVARGPFGEEDPPAEVFVGARTRRSERPEWLKVLSIEDVIEMVYEATQTSPKA